MTEPFRRLPDPIVGDDGTLKGMSVLTPEAMTTIGGIAIPSSKVIPVIVVPGIMGSNLRATTNKKQAQNQELSAGSPAWRPPNGATIFGERPESAVMMPIMPASTAING